VKRAIRIGLLCVLALAPSAVEGQGLYSRDAAKQPGSPSWLKELASLPAFDPPRLPDGTPDLQGTWTGPNGGDDIEEHGYVDVSSPPEETYISDPPGGRVPYQPWALVLRNEIRTGLARGWPGEKERLYTDPQTFCLYTVPRATTRGGFEIIQAPGYVLMAFNFAHYYRSIPLNAAMPHVSPAVKQWMGNSRGHWEGNTLVVDVTGITGKNWLDQVGNFFSENVHVVERFTLAAAASSTTRSRSTIPPSSRGRGRCGSRCGAVAARKRGSTPASKGTATTPNTFARSASSGSRA
jgi:hypothetical protein